MNMKKLVIYYSQANGNTRRIAEMITSEIISEKAIQFDSIGGDHLETSLNEIENWIRSL
jgi:flavodoxin